MAHRRRQALDGVKINDSTNLFPCCVRPALTYSTKTVANLR